MIGIFNTVSITYNGTTKEIFRPSEFELAKEDVYAAEYTTCTGKTIADRIGWKYSDMEIGWDTLPNDALTFLNGINGIATLTFTDLDGSHSEQFVRSGYSNIPTRLTYADGSAIWQSVKFSMRFLNVHND